MRTRPLRRDHCRRSGFLRGASGHLSFTLSRSVFGACTAITTQNARSKRRWSLPRRLMGRSANADVIGHLSHLARSSVGALPGAVPGPKTSRSGDFLRADDEFLLRTILVRAARAGSARTRVQSWGPSLRRSRQPPNLVSEFLEGLVEPFLGYRLAVAGFVRHEDLQEMFITRASLGGRRWPDGASGL